jgi:hypothetical protein
MKLLFSTWAALPPTRSALRRTSRLAHPTKQERKGSGTPTDVLTEPPRLAGAAARAFACARLSAFHRDVLLEMSEHLRPASGHASWDAAATITLLSGRYPPLPVPVQCAPHGRPRLPAADTQSRPGAICETARGHRTRSVCRIASGYVPALSERGGRNVFSDNCQARKRALGPYILKTSRHGP